MLGQKLLEAVFGDQALRNLAEQARRRLETRVRALLDEERHRYLDLLASLGIEPEAAERLRNAARAVDDLRYAAWSAPTPTRSPRALRGASDGPARHGRPGPVSDDGAGVPISLRRRHP